MSLVSQFGNRRIAAVISANLGVAAAYFLAGEVGLQLALVREQVTPLWPCTGIAVVCLLVLGLRAVPGVALGAFLVNVAIGPSLGAVMFIVAGNTLAPLVAYLLLRRVDFRMELSRLRDTLALIFLGGFAGMLVSATIGTTTLLLFDAIGSDAFLSTWSVWWTGDAMGVLIFAPALLLLNSSRSAWPATPGRWIEYAAVMVGMVVFMGVAVAGLTPLLFPVFPFVVWAAARFEHVGAAPAALIASGMAALAAAGDVSRFAGLDLTATMITLQGFNGSVALTGLLLATVTKQRNEAQRAVEETCQALAITATRLSGARTLDERTQTAVSRLMTVSSKERD